MFIVNNKHTLQKHLSQNNKENMNRIGEKKKTERVWVRGKYNKHGMILAN